MAVKHTKVATTADDGTSEVGTNEWNDNHTIDNSTITNDHLAGSIANGKLATDPLARANHTGTQAASTVSDFDTEVANNSAVAANTAKTGITSGQASAITANTAKTGITSGQASAITANTAKTGITSGQASAIVANTAKTGITSAQASAISANTAKVSLTDNSVTLAKLAHGTADKVLGFDGSGVPSEITVGGGGKVVLLDDHVASSTENSYTYTPSPSLNMESTYSKIFVVWSLNECSATSAIRLNLNGLGSGQNSDGIRFDGSSVTNMSGAGLAGMYLEAGVVASVGYSGITEFVYNVSGGGHTQSIRAYSRGCGDLGSFRVGTIWQGNFTGTGNTITSIKIDLVVNSAHYWVAGSRIMTYGVEL